MSGFPALRHLGVASCLSRPWLPFLLRWSREHDAHRPSLVASPSLPCCRATLSSARRIRWNFSFVRFRTNPLDVSYTVRQVRQRGTSYGGAALLLAQVGLASDREQGCAARHLSHFHWETHDGRSHKRTTHIRKFIFMVNTSSSRQSPVSGRDGHQWQI